MDLNISTSDTAPLSAEPAAGIVQAPRTGRCHVEYQESGLAVISLGVPERFGEGMERLVTLTTERLESLREAFAGLKATPPRGLVITGTCREMFTAGADIKLIRDVTDAHYAETMARQGQELFSTLANFPFPTVAAISGPCVGGGCELVLACDMRIISDHKSSVIGLPEIKLGILPGFGGTQRLPRLVGLPKALDIILAGKTLRPKQAIACGLVDEICSFERLIGRAAELASSSSVPKGKAPSSRRRLSLKDRFLTFTGFGRRLVQKQASAAVKKETKGFYPAPSAALSACILGLEQGLETGLKFEAKELGRLIVSPESKALVRIFFLTESAKALGKSASNEVQQLNCVVVGAGVMGAGIAALLARNDCQVILKDTSDDALERALQHIRDGLAKQKYLTESERSFILNRIERSKGDPPNQSNAHYVFEAIVEDLEVKRRVLGELARHLPDDAIIATNTSSLSVSDIAAGISDPSRVVGFHFFNPVEKMPLVEVIRGQQTSNRSVVVSCALASKLGKFPVVVEDVHGFLVNRILAPYLMEASALLADGFDVQFIDQVALDFGLPMGPLRLLDEIGLDVAAHVSDTMEKAYGHLPQGERMRSQKFADKLVSLGRKGEKGGGGFYDFGPQGAVPCPEIRKMLGIEKSVPSPVPDVVRKEAADRMILALINEGIRCLDQGVAGSPGKEAASQIDLATVMGMGFPPFRGGLVYYSEQLGAAHIQQRLSQLAQKCGSRLAPWEGITRRAESGGSFYRALG